MGILSFLSIKLRNCLVKQHPYFSCCASCGEIRDNPGNLLCASLPLSFVPDVVYVLPPGLNPEETDLDLTPAQGTVFIAPSDGRCLYRPKDGLLISLPDTQGPSWLRIADCDEVREHFLVRFLAPDLRVGPCDARYHFTPNGLPSVNPRLLPEYADDSPLSPPLTIGLTREMLGSYAALNRNQAEAVDGLIPAVVRVLEFGHERCLCILNPFEEQEPRPATPGPAASAMKKTNLVR